MAVHSNLLLNVDNPTAIDTHTHSMDKAVGLTEKEDEHTGYSHGKELHKHVSNRHTQTQ